MLLTVDQDAQVDNVDAASPRLYDLARAQAQPFLQQALTPAETAAAMTYLQNLPTFFHLLNSQNSIVELAHTYTLKQAPPASQLGKLTVLFDADGAGTFKFASGLSQPPHFGYEVTWQGALLAAVTGQPIFMGLQPQRRHCFSSMLISGSMHLS